MRALPAPLLALLLAAGCVTPAALPEDPLGPQAAPAAPDAAPGKGPSFEMVRTFPQAPRSGQEVLVRASVTAPGFEQPPVCLLLVGPEGARGGGGGYSGSMSRVDAHAYECLAPPGVANDFVAALLVGHDGASYVRSDLILLRTPDGPAAGRPPSEIRDFRVEPLPGGDLRVVVQVDPALALPGAPLTTGVAQLERLPRDFHAYYGLGLRLEAKEPGVLEATYPLVYPQEGGTPESGRDPDFTLLGFAYTYNDLGGFDATGLLEVGLGACATQRCVRT